MRDLWPRPLLVKATSRLYKAAESMVCLSVSSKQDCNGEGASDSVKCQKNRRIKLVSLAMKEHCFAYLMLRKRGGYVWIE